jgi:hypothetical protein
MAVVCGFGLVFRVRIETKTVADIASISGGSSFSYS